MVAGGGAVAGGRGRAVAQQGARGVPQVVRALGVHDPGAGERDERVELGLDLGGEPHVAKFSYLDGSRIPGGSLAGLDQLADLRRAARVQVDVALADRRLLLQQARPRAAPPPPPGRARGRCRRNRAGGGRTRCGSRPICPSRRAAGGSGARRAAPGRGRRAGATVDAIGAEHARARRPRSRRARRPGGRRGARPPRRSAAGGARRSARAARRRRSRPAAAPARVRAGGRCRPAWSSKTSISSGSNSAAG